MQKNTLDWRKKRDDACSLMQQLTHPAHPKGSYRLRTCVGKFSDTMEKTHNRKQGSRQNTKDKTKKKNVQKTLVRN